MATLVANLKNMATLVANLNNRFNPITDPSRPKIEEIEYQRKKYMVKEVDWIEKGKIIKMVMDKTEPDKKGHDEVLFIDHISRPFVMWVVYVDEIKSLKNKKSK
jgi:hypothetical protein